MADPLTILVALLAGLLAGLAAGLFGVGGGVVMVPVLHYLLGLPFVLSTQVSLFVITVNTPFGLWRQHRHGTVRWRYGLGLTAGGAVGVALAIGLRPFIPVDALKVVFAGVGLFAAYRMLRPAGALGAAGLTRSRGSVPGGNAARGSMFRPLRLERHGHNPFVLVLAGVAGGAAAHWLGIGGGLIMVPALVFLGLPIHQAVATSLVAVFTNAAVSTVWDLPVLVHELGRALPLAVGAVVGIRLGVHVANRTHADRLRRGFAVFLGLMAAYILWDTLLA